MACVMPASCSIPARAAPSALCLDVANCPIWVCTSIRRMPVLYSSTFVSPARTAPVRRSVRDHRHKLPASISEIKFRRQLDLAHSDRRSEDLPELRRAERGRGLAEVRVVEGVVELSAKLKSLFSLSNRHDF